MTGKPGHSGGKREGQGRPFKPGKRYHVSIRCDEATYRAILAGTTAEERAPILLNAIDQKRYANQPA